MSFVKQFCNQPLGCSVGCIDIPSWKTLYFWLVRSSSLESISHPGFGNRHKVQVISSRITVEFTVTSLCAEVLVVGLSLFLQ